MKQLILKGFLPTILSGLSGAKISKQIIIVGDYSLSLSPFCIPTSLFWRDLLIHVVDWGEDEGEDLKI